MLAHIRAQGTGGWRIRYRGDIAVRHKVCPERRVTWSGTRWFHFVRNRLYIARKWHAGWFALLPRIAFYLIRGARNGVLDQTLAALPAAFRMASGAPVRRHSADALRYIRMNDIAYRGSLATQIRRAVSADLPFARAKA
jgi:GT2 family glycosyltransferase